MAGGSRDAILASVRKNLPSTRTPLPDLEPSPGSREPLLDRFERSLETLGGRSWRPGSVAEAVSKIAEIHPAAKAICSTAPEVRGTIRIEEVNDPRDLAGVDVGVVRARFGVAETGAVWVTQDDLVVNALAFLPQHIVVLLDPDDLVRDMHEAYRRVRLGDSAYGCFVAGPSATGDIEGVIIRGAQGPRSLSLFFLKRP